MVHQRWKDFHFIITRVLTKPNYYRYKLLNKFRRRKTAQLYLNIGCGPRKIKRFVNIDYNLFYRPDMWLNVCNGLPFHDGTVDGIYCSEILEHLYTDERDSLLKECYRLLKVGGGIRVIVPNLGNAIQSYVRENVEWFKEKPYSYRTIGGRLSNFLFMDGQHRDCFDYNYLCEVLEKAGFTNVVQLKDGQSSIYNGEILCQVEGKAEKYRLYIECFRT